MAKVYLSRKWRGSILLVTICDENLLGKKFVEGKLVLNVKEEFYRGELVDVEDALDALEGCHSAILIGENTIQAAIKRGIVHPDGVHKVQNVPFTHIFRFL